MIDRLSPRPPLSRRDFLSRTSLALAGVVLADGMVLAPRVVGALPARSSQPLSAFMPDIVDADTMRQLGRAAVEAATSVGAQYADIRLAMRRTFASYMTSPLWAQSSLVYDYSYGVRACVGGAWAFVGGADPTLEGVTRAARQATMTARGLSRVMRVRADLAPAPVATGEWRTPVQIDPFSVSPDDHVAMLSAFRQAAERVTGADLSPGFNWASETRVFASSEGSLLTQYLTDSTPSLSVAASSRVGGRVLLGVDGVTPLSAGFETVVGPELQDRIMQTAEHARRLFAYPLTSADVGRYDAVFSGAALAALLGEMLVPGLELSRVLGEEADGAGTSIFAPVDDVLGQPMFSPELSVAADRTAPHLGAAKWDDEGVLVAPMPVIEKGAIVDYFGTRTTVSAMRDWYTKRGRPLGSRGTAVAWSPMRAPVGSPAALVMQPGTGGSLETVAKAMGNGLLVWTMWDVNADQQVSGAMASPELLFEVKRGEITRRLRGGVFPLRTKTFWKSIRQLGDASSIGCRVRRQYSGVPWTPMRTSVYAPAALCTDLNVTTYTGAMR